MAVIAMTQEMGSLAKDVAMELASTMNLSMLRHEVVDHVAGKMHVSSSLIKRLREGKAGLIERATADTASMALYTAEEVYELANRGNVVLRGWGATCLLRPVPHVVTVRITRSFHKRVEWLMNHLETDDRDFAESEIRRSDHAHATRMHQLFGVTWGDPVLYDLVLNTDRLSVHSCVEQIRQLTQRPEFQASEASRQLLANMALSAHVRSALKANESTQEVNITVEAQQGRVVLKGIVVNEQEHQQAERVAAAVKGVTGVENRLRLMKATRTFTYSKT
ncbi:MAG: cytidylate kinase family protein [Hylemonella sp.]|uniref:cytidylate kinase family protein n=1 Tax=Hylemonella sp. TaxID=2066020 RepID=UPI0022C153DF|nr:cytidylate kinase family protein [Hylemonella sp.]MCZ8251346.1 cytidylate kinase family protein [Hylemonella sp.]